MMMEKFFIYTLKSRNQNAKKFDFYLGAWFRDPITGAKSYTNRILIDTLVIFTFP